MRGSGSASKRRRQCEWRWKLKWKWRWLDFPSSLQANSSFTLLCCSFPPLPSGPITWRRRHCNDGASAQRALRIESAKESSVGVEGGTAAVGLPLRRCVNAGGRSPAHCPWVGRRPARQPRSLARHDSCSHSSMMLTCTTVPTER